MPDGQADASGRADQPVPRVHPSAGGGRGWKLAWHDEFDEATCPDPSKWGFERGFLRNVELQWYQRRNAFCRGGILHLEARRSDRPNPNHRPGSHSWERSRTRIRYTSASLKTKSTFTYGRFEIRARIDTRSGSWPVFWTLGTGRWPGQARPSTGAEGPETGQLPLRVSMRAGSRSGRR